MTKKLLLLALTGALAACGGGNGSAASAQSMAANAPTYDKLALSQSDADNTMPAAMPSTSSGQNDATVADCHPHLFERSHEIVGRMNRHFAKHLRHVEELIKSDPKLVAQGTATWESIKDGIDRKLTITAKTNSDGSVTYSFELDVKSTGDFVKVMDGFITHKGPATADTKDATSVAVENSGDVNFDFTALHSVVPTEKATGKVTDTFDNVHDPVKGEKRIATVSLDAFVPEEGDKHGPRTGKYLWEREPSVGGSFEFEDTLVLLCPSNPTNAAADLIAVARWYKASDGGLHGRSDAQASGGQMTSGQKWMGVTCAQGQTTSAPAEGYWMIKEEDSSGATIVGQADTMGSAPCDTAAFGAAPNVGDNKNDFNFAGVDFSAPYPFPNSW